MKTCSCGRRYSRVEWEALQFVGIHYDALDPERLDLRNCESCKSTTAIELPDGVSVCVDCGTWIENERKVVVPSGARCTECGPMYTVSPPHHAFSRWVKTVDPLDLLS